MKKPKNLTIELHSTGQPVVRAHEMTADALNHLIEVTEELRNFVAKHCLNIAENSGEIRLEAMKAIEAGKTALKAAGYTEEEPQGIDLRKQPQPAPKQAEKQAEEFYVWDAVEKYYPKYQSCDEIARMSDLDVIIDEEVEEDSCAERLERELLKDFGNDIRSAKDLYIKLQQQEQENYILRKTIEAMHQEIFTLSHY